MLIALRAERRRHVASQTLLELIRSSRDKVKDAFNRHDFDNSHALDANEIFQFLLSVLPQASQADGLYFRVRLFVRVCFLPGQRVH